jgi:heterodisulfide reductase subunit B
MNQNGQQAGGAKVMFFQPKSGAAGAAAGEQTWMHAVVDKRTMGLGERMHDVREQMWQLEKEGEIIVQRITPAHEPVVVKTLYGWDKPIPTKHLWHHKSCGQCGNIPGYPTSLLWTMNQLGFQPGRDYLDETDQTSCTAWNYHGSGIGNLESLSAVFLRNFHQAYVSGKRLGLPDGHFFPLVHCGTSFGNYKEVRKYIIESPKLRERMKQILGKIGRLVDGKIVIPEEVVHYSEWVHVMRNEIATKLQKYDVSMLKVAIHPACHYYKMVAEDAVYDDTIMGGNRTASGTSVALALGAQVVDYSTWYDCCGFGFRHIISEREFTRSFAINRKIKVAREEAGADIMLGIDTGCITTLDKNQWIGKAHGETATLPVMADIQFAALACGADPFKIVQLQWHASPVEDICERMGISWTEAKARFEGYVEEVKAGRIEYLYDPQLAISSGAR